MKILNILGYNSDIKIAGNVITFKTYQSNQVYNYQVKANHKVNVKVKEILEEQKKERFIKSTERAKRRIFDLIACNVDKHLDYNNKQQRTKFLTLTFKENIQDITTANEEITKFFKRLSYYIYGIRTNVIKYLTVPELQKRGAWHFHIILFNMGYIPHHALKKIWTVGSICINALNNSVDGTTIARYMTKYIAKGININAENEVEINNNEENEGTKRLSDYEVYKKNGMEEKKRYYTSRGLFQPYQAKIKIGQAEQGVIYNYLLDNAKKDNEGKKMFYYKEYNNEYRGEIDILSIEVSEDILKGFKSFVEGVARYNRKQYSRENKINWNKVQNILNKKREQQYYNDEAEIEKQELKYRIMIAGGI